jgi:hypothetical protein
MDNTVKKKLITFLENGQIVEAISFIKLLKADKPKRTGRQNSALHLWLTMVAGELDKRGFTLQDIIKAIKRAEIRPTMENMKECVWKPYQEAALGKKSTTQLEKQEVDVVYEGLNKFLGDHFDGIHIPWPSKEAEDTLLKNIETAKKVEYNDDYKEPTI